MALFEQKDFLGAKNFVSLQTLQPLQSDPAALLVQVSGTPSELPTFPFPAVIGSGSDKELVLCTAVDSNNWVTLNRSYFGQNLKYHSTGSAFRVLVVAEYVTELQDEVNFLTNELSNVASAFMMIVNTDLADRVLVVPYADSLLVSGVATSIASVDKGVAFITQPSSGGNPAVPLIYSSHVSQEVDLSSYVPAAGRFVSVLIYLDVNRNIQVISGTSGTVDPPDPPLDPATPFLKLAYIKLNVSGIVEIVDARNS